MHRADNMIIQSISLLDQLDKDINTFSMRIRYVTVIFNSAFNIPSTFLLTLIHYREWYSYHFPELVKIIPDNYLYAKVN